ncbi:IclR family transcriptional regulator [Sphingomonas sp. H160509]|uniref:IclR family transcriptional regulator n=1 Tax=Sphingomonas sp. H160509 TaxID=2955313 RepID=UPI0020975C18|nr:IclR family transcriptional regulator [Sphingomonas sp. H160509]MDD1449671.1 IclR family transcriptional regulator [Sphingomonas sp. H160509]
MRPVQTALNVLEVIAHDQPVGLSAIARELELPKTTVHRVLQTLQAAGWIAMDAEARGDWTITIKAGLAVGSAQHATAKLRGAAFPIMEELRTRTGESVYLAIREGDTLALIERLDGPNPIAHAWPLWQRGPLHATSLGKSMLALLPVEDVTHYLDKPLTRNTRRTLVQPAALFAELALIEERGFATSFRENWPNENGVGAAIRDARGQPTAAISISAPTDRVSEVQCLELGPPDRRRGAADRLGTGKIMN